MTKENTTPIEESVLIGASKLMVEVFESGLYREMKSAENKLESIKRTIRKQFENGESRRYQLPNDIIAKFVPYPVYETDEEGLKEFLDDFGLLTQTITLKAKFFKEDPALLEQLTAFQMPVDYFAQFYLNKNGKTHLDKENYVYQEDLALLSLLFLEAKLKLEDTKNQYKGMMRKIEACPILRQAKSLKTKYGTCKLREKDIEFHVNDVYNELGNDFLIQYGKVSMESLDDFIAKGYFSEKDIQQFRKVKDINLRFVVMERYAEIKQLESFHQQRMSIAQKKRFA